VVHQVQHYRVVLPMLKQHWHGWRLMAGVAAQVMATSSTAQGRVTGSTAQGMTGVGTAHMVGHPAQVVGMPAEAVATRVEVQVEVHATRAEVHQYPEGHQTLVCTLSGLTTSTALIVN
jgi:hypothetical protein